MVPEGTITPVDQAVEWVSEPHPELIDVIKEQVVAGWDPNTALEMWGSVYPLTVLITLLLFVGVAYCALRIRQIRALEYARFHQEARPVVSQDTPRAHLRWRRILEHAQSADQHQWRLAILEADIMLNDLLDVLGYRGETMGEKLKSVNRAQFHTIEQAWEAHKTRNRVAHESADQPLSEREKNAVIAMYQSVFREHGVIP